MMTLWLTWVVESRVPRKLMNSAEGLNCSRASSALTSGGTLLSSREDGVAALVLRAVENQR